MGDLPILVGEYVPGPPNLSTFTGVRPVVLVKLDKGLLGLMIDDALSGL